MNKTIQLAAALLLVVLAISGCAPDNQADAAASPEIIEQEMETFLKAYAATGEFMGAVLVARGKEPEFI
jgi:hypothetical protein